MVGGNQIKRIRRQLNNLVDEDVSVVDYHRKPVIKGVLIRRYNPSSKEDNQGLYVGGTQIVVGNVYWTKRNGTRGNIIKLRTY